MFLSWISSWVALALGIGLAVLLGNPYEGRTSNLTKQLLKISVVAIGFGYPITAISELSVSSFYFVVIFILIALLLGFIIGKILKVERRTADLITSGTILFCLKSPPPITFPALVLAMTNFFLFLK